MFVKRSDSVTPLLQWEDDYHTKHGVKAPYDVAIWSFHRGLRGPMIYSRESISGFSHRVEMSLKPDTTYYWSVRLAGTSEWSTVSDRSHSLGDNSSYSGQYWMFRTPKE